MKQRKTLFLKLGLFLIVFPILTFFVFVLPWVVSGLVEVFPVPPYLQYLGFIGLYGAIVPFLFALYQAIKLLSHINKNNALSQIPVMALKNIKYSARTISALYVIGMPLIFRMGDADDAPGLVLFGLIIILVAGVSAVYAAIFEKRYHSAKIGK
jgi:hypothetical protein